MLSLRHSAGQKLTPVRSGAGEEVKDFYAKIVQVHVCKKRLNSYIMNPTKLILKR
jgi:hypothetical protein